MNLQAFSQACRLPSEHSYVPPPWQILSKSLVLRGPSLMDPCGEGRTWKNTNSIARRIKMVTKALTA